MSTPALLAGPDQPSPARLRRRRVYLALLGLVPFPVKLWVARHVAPNLVRYLPAGRQVTVSGYARRFRVALDTRYPIEALMIANHYEPRTRRLVERLVRPGDHCVDAGANVGAITFVLAASVGDAGRVLAFEPGPPTYARLRRNVELNPELAGRVVPVPAGLADRPGELHWVEDANVPGNASLVASGGAVVPVTTVDRALAEHGFPRLDFAKLDVEGMEYDVLLGASHTLRTSRPLLYFETLPGGMTADGRTQFTAIEALLRPLDYRLFAVDKSGALVPATTDSHAMYTLAVPASRVDEVRQRLRAA